MENDVQLFSLGNYMDDEWYQSLKRNRLAKKAFDFIFSLLSLEAPGNYPRRQVVSGYMQRSGAQKKRSLWKYEPGVCLSIADSDATASGCDCIRKGYKVGRGPRAASCVCVCESHSVVVKSLQPHGLWPTMFLCPWDSLGKNTEWVIIPFSRASCQPRD